MNPGSRRRDAPQVDIVVLNWNGWHDTLACLRSLERLTYPRCRVIVVDNGSTDGSVDRIRGSFPDVAIIETGTNLGFAGGNNVAIRRSLAKGVPFVWLLNNDTVVSPDALRAMVEEMLRAEDVGIVGSVNRAMNDPVTVEAWGGGTVNRYLGTTRRLTRAGEGEPAYIAGTSMLVRREVFEDVGLLDEGFFLYLEDVDFCMRATARGWRLAVAGDAAVLHKGGATANGGGSRRSLLADRMHARSSGFFVAKHAGPWVLPAAAVRLTGMVVRRVLRGQVHQLPAAIRGFVQGLANGLRRSP